MGGISEPPCAEGPHPACARRRCRRVNPLWALGLSQPTAFGTIRVMNSDVVDTLLTLNRTFYNDFAGVFSASRSPTEPGFERLVEQIEPGARVLDLGCGQARLFRLLPAGCSYTGIDYAEAMLALAPPSGTGVAGNPRSEKQAQTRSSEAPAGLPAPVPVLVAADLLRDAWSERIHGPFDWVVLRAVLHHIPGYTNRQLVLSRAAEVLGSKGRIVIANWQFLRIARLRRRFLAWSTLGLMEDDVEPGDYLLDWQRQGRGVRYAHHVDEEETRRLASGAGLGIAELFYADGHTNDLTCYAVLRREGLPAP
jgi:SAM-dependent methyltransferase